MTPEEQNMVNLLVDSVKQTHAVLTTHEKRLDTITSTLAQSIAESKMSIVIVGQILAQLSKFDRDRLDRLLADTVVFVEARAAEADERTRSVILPVLDDVVPAAEAAFLRLEETGT